MPREIEKLEGLDLSKITLAELARLKNSVLRQALISALEAASTPAGAEHTNHWKFTSHGKAMVLSDNPLPIVGIGPQSK